MGALADLRGPSPLIQGFIRRFAAAYDVNLDEALVPAAGFDSFDDFFTRQLKPGARPLDEREQAVLSPADGKVEDLGTIGPHSTLHVKGTEYSVGELLGDDQAAEVFRDGRFFIVYLSPRDYHRVHVPVTGKVSWARHVPGTLLPVNSIGLRYFPGLFARNERVVTTQHSEQFGTVATIMVGAIGVGRITMRFDPRIVTNSGRDAGVIRYGDDGPELRRGEELGMFHLGSTAIVMLGADAPGEPYDFEVEEGQAVRMGQAVAVAQGRHG